MEKKLDQCNCVHQMSNIKSPVLLKELNVFTKLFSFLQRLEEIMRRTRRTDSPDTVRFTLRI